MCSQSTILADEYFDGLTEIDYQDESLKLQKVKEDMKKNPPEEKVVILANGDYFGERNKNKEALEYREGMNRLRQLRMHLEKRISESIR